MNNFLELSDKITHNQVEFLSNITDIMNGDLCIVIPALKACNSTYNYTIILEKGLKSLVSYYFESVREAHQYYIENKKDINNAETFFIDNIFTSVRFLIENISDILDELYNQFYYVQQKNFSELLIDIIVLAIIMNILFFAVLVYKLNQFITNLINEEMMSNKLIGEIPLEVIEGNKELEEALKVATDFIKKNK